jgi:hypothetical protein
VRRVGEHEPRDVALLLEEERDAGVLEHPADKPEIGLGVLDAVFSFFIRAGQPEVGLDVPLGEDLPDDVGLRHVLEDAVIAPLGREPEVGDDGDLIGREAALFEARLVELAADARPGALGEARPEGEARRPADDRVEVNRRIFGEGYQRDGEER